MVVGSMYIRRKHTGIVVEQSQGLAQLFFPWNHSDTAAQGAMTMLHGQWWMLLAKMGTTGDV